MRRTFTLQDTARFYFIHFCVSTRWILIVFLFFFKHLSLKILNSLVIPFWFFRKCAVKKQFSICQKTYEPQETSVINVLFQFESLFQSLNFQWQKRFTHSWMKCFFFYPQTLFFLPFNSWSAFCLQTYFHLNVQRIQFALFKKI